MSSANEVCYDKAVSDFFQTQVVTEEPKPASIASGKQTSEKPAKATTQSQLQCKLCNKSFKKRYNLKIHQRSHTGETPLACTHEGCSLKFRWRSSLINHLRYHSPAGLAKPAKSAKSAPKRSPKKPSQQFENTDNSYGSDTSSSNLSAKEDMVFRTSPSTPGLDIMTAGAERREWQSNSPLTHESQQDSEVFPSLDTDFQPRRAFDFLHGGDAKWL